MQLSTYTGHHCNQCGAPDWTSSSDGFHLSTPVGPAWICDGCAAADAYACDACAHPIWPGEQSTRAVPLTHDGHEYALVHAGCEPSHLLRCVWEVWDEPGGPEEGGWTFEAGRLLAAVPVPLEACDGSTSRAVSTTGLQTTDALLQGAFGSLESRTVRLRFTIEVALPDPSFPQCRPHYE